MSEGLTRRDFIRATAAGAVAVGWGLGEAGGAAEGKIPQRVLGKTGVRVPILGYGTASTGERRTTEDAVKLYNEAIDMGITYIDTAPEFVGYGKAQVQLGHALKGRRKEVFLVTKCFRAKADDALKLLESNLKELQTDYADLVYAHSIGSDPQMPLEVITGQGGVMEFLAKAKKEGLTRFIGISGHNRPWKFLKVLEDFEIDVMMNAVNFVDKHTYDFEGKVWPVAAKKNVGLVAMKVFGGEKNKSLSNSRMPTEHLPLAFRYALSQPRVACAVVGMATLEEVRGNVEWARNFKPLSKEELASLDSMGKELAAEWKAHFGEVV